jgi:hypothetical protein
VLLNAQPVIRTRVHKNHSREQDFLLAPKIGDPGSIPVQTKHHFSAA